MTPRRLTRGPRGTDQYANGHAELAIVVNIMECFDNNVYWIGGSPCCGKSSVAEVLVDRFGLNYYKCDDHFDSHLKRCEAQGLPISSLLRSVTHEYIFMRSHEENVDLVFAIFAEEFKCVLEDIAAMPRPLIVEGCVLLPESLHGIGVDSSSKMRLYSC